MKDMVKEEREAAEAEGTTSSSSSSSSSENRYTAFIDRPGPGAELAAKVCSEMFGKGATLTNSEDPNEIDDEDVMSKKGRRCNPGAVISKQNWRDHKEEVVKKKVEKEEKKKTTEFEEYERVCEVVAEWEKIKEVALADMTIPQLKVYIEMRTTKKVKGSLNKAPLKDMAEKESGEVRLKEPNVPEGYALWKQQQVQAAQAAAAAPPPAPAATPAQAPPPTFDLSTTQNRRSSCPNCSRACKVFEVLKFRC